jgi:hypothetical protein
MNSPAKDVKMKLQKLPMACGEIRHQTHGALEAIDALELLLHAMQCGDAMDAHTNSILPSRHQWSPVIHVHAA